MEAGDTVLIAFDSTQQALRAEMLLEYVDIEIDTRPTPKEITAGCSLSIELPISQYDEARAILNSEKVEVRGYYRRFGERYEPIDESGRRSAT